MDKRIVENPASVGREQRGTRADSIASGRVFAALISLFLFVLLLGIVLSRSWVLRTLEEFDLGLSVVSLVALSPVLPATVAVLLILMLVKQVSIRSPKLAMAGNMTALAAGLLLLVIYLIGIITPFILLVDTLS